MVGFGKICTPMLLNGGLKYKKITIYHAVYIKVFSDGTVSCLRFYADDVLNNTNNKISFPELRIVLIEAFEIKVQEGYVVKYLHLRIFQSPLGFSID